jgi:hypothetical protein
MDSDAKLTVLVPLKISEEMNADLILAAGGERKRQGFIRAGIPCLIERAKEERNGKVTPAERAALAEARRLHIDPVATLRERIAQVSP